MNIFDLEKYTNLASKKIIDFVMPLPENQVDEDALKIILFATEHGLGCRETAEAIADNIEKSTDIKLDFFFTIQDLMLDPYFHPTMEIFVLAEAYLERVKNVFLTQEEDDEFSIGCISNPERESEPMEIQYDNKQKNVSLQFEG